MKLRRGQTVVLNDGISTGVLVSPKLDDNYWTVDLDDGDHGPTSKVFHVSQFKVVKR